MNRSELEKALACFEDSRSAQVLIGETPVEISVRAALLPEEEAAFAASVAESILIYGKRHYGLLEYAYRVNLVVYYTDLPLPSTPAAVSALIYRTNVIEKIRELASDQMLTLYHACSQQIAAAEKAEHTPDPLDRIADAIEQYLDNASTSLQGFDMDKLTTLASKFLHVQPPQDAASALQSDATKS